MAPELLVAGGGIAGLSAALAAHRAGWRARVFEQAGEFAEVGAGLQLGPNATRLLRAWPGVSQEVLRPFAPQRLRVRDAIDGRELGTLRLGAEAQQRHGAPYWTAHRADLHAALLEAARQAGVQLRTGIRGVAADEQGARARLQLEGDAWAEADALAVADGVWSSLRRGLLQDGDAPATGHVAYRALVPAHRVPPALWHADVEAWLAPRMHLVRYPVRAGEALNIVGFIEGQAERGWDHAAQADALRQRARGLCAPLQALVDMVEVWRLWPVHDREPLRGPQAMARGRAALLGDAAHPMRPYLAQGAGMAIEDAAALELALARCAGDLPQVPAAFAAYAAARWERCARVQRRSRRNGWIFHSAGPLRLSRNLAMRLGGEALLDLPWLYGGDAGNAPR